MSGIEKMHLLVLALNRVKKHYHLYKWDCIDTSEISRHVEGLSAALNKIKKWEKFVEYCAEDWVDLRDQYVSREDGCAEYSYCIKCDERAEQIVNVEGHTNAYLCVHHAAEWKKVSTRAFGRAYEQAFQKWILM